MRVFLFAFMFLVGNSNSLSAQDPIFGQFYAAPNHLNPAMTGLFQGSVRVNLNYREQWQSIMPSTPFRTMGASFEWRNRALKNDYFTLAFNALRDQVGTSNFTTTRGNIGFSYAKQLSGGRYQSSDQFLIAGGQVGAGQHKLNYEKLWFSRQFDASSGDVNLTLSNGENFTQTSTDMYLDFNAGLLWYALFDDNLSIYAGGAMFHLNSPNISFLGDANEVLSRRWLLNVGGEIPFSKQLSILPGFMITGQNVSRTMMMGGNLRYTNRDWREVALRAGVFGQVSNKLEDEMLFHSLIFGATLEMEKWSIGISYDVNVSSVSALSNGRGAYELSFIYVQPAKYREKVKCPKY